MPRQIDPKYSITGDLEIVNLTGVPIPDDEPLILFRARDRNALKMLYFYRRLCEADGCTDFHMTGTWNRIEAFEKFREEHPERMKQPGITKGK